MEIEKVLLSGTIAAVAALLLGGAPAFAQSPLNQPEPVQYIVSPENPGPNTFVDISIQGVGNFLGNSSVTWQQNGKTVASGTGLREFSFTTGPLGQATTVTATIISSDYGTITHTWSFNPSRIDVVWEGETSAPPLFGGRTLPSAGSKIKVFAFPEIFSGGTAVSASALSFQWQTDGQPDPADSGLGRNILSLTANQLHQSTAVTVSVMRGGTSVGQGSVTIGYANPELVFYLHDPLRGVLYNRSLGTSFTMNATEATVRAEPYFFSTNAFTQGALTYSWQLNGQDTTGPNTAAGELTLRQTGSGPGNASLSVSLQNTNAAELLQTAQANLFIAFGGTQNNSNLFGL